MWQGKASSWGCGVIPMPIEKREDPTANCRWTGWVSETSGWESRHFKKNLDNMLSSLTRKTEGCLLLLLGTNWKINCKKGNQAHLPWGSQRKIVKKRSRNNVHLWLNHPSDKWVGAVHNTMQYERLQFHTSLFTNLACKSLGYFLLSFIHTEALSWALNVSAHFKKQQERIQTTLIIPTRVCYYSLELRNTITM